MKYLTVLMISMFVTIALMPILKELAVRMRFVDMPDHRKMHKQPMPKIGGLAMAFGVLAPVILWVEADLFIRATLLGAAIIVGFGILDDIKTLGYKAKLIGQIASALVVILLGAVRIKSIGGFMPTGTELPDFLSIPLTLIVMVGVTNAINLSDGLDGLAGGIAILSFICIAYLAYQTNATAVALLAVAVTGAIFGFLRFNTYPATVFMGDTGSQLLGFLAITTALKLTQGETPYSPLLPLILLGFPILDTLAVMIERIAKGQSPFIADKNHFHHKLMRRGLFHTEAVFIIYVLQSLLVTAAYLLRFYSEGILLALYVVFSSTIVAGFVMGEKYDFQLSRYDLIDRVIKGKMQWIKNQNITIKLSFRMLKYGLPLLLFFTIWIPEEMPKYFGYISLVLGLMVLWSRLFIRGNWMGMAIRIGLYMVIPFLVYLSQRHQVSWIGMQMEILYNVSFVALALFMILTLKFTRRQKGFKTTPMDFLILFIALVIPNLPETELMSHSFSMIAVRVIVFLFGYEVLLGELRNEFDGIGLITIVSLLVLSVRVFYMGA